MDSLYTLSTAVTIGHILRQQKRRPSDSSAAPRLFSRVAATPGKSSGIARAIRGYSPSLLAGCPTAIQPRPSYARQILRNCSGYSGLLPLTPCRLPHGYSAASQLQAMRHLWREVADNTKRSPKAKLPMNCALCFDVLFDTRLLYHYFREKSSPKNRFHVNIA